MIPRASMCSSRCSQAAAAIKKRRSSSKKPEPKKKTKPEASFSQRYQGLLLLYIHSKFIVHYFLRQVARKRRGHVPSVILPWSSFSQSNNRYTHELLSSSRNPRPSNLHQSIWPLGISNHTISQGCYVVPAATWLKIDLTDDCVEGKKDNYSHTRTLFSPARCQRLWRSRRGVPWSGF